MSKQETPMTLAYWEQVGGTLLEEYRIVDDSATCRHRDVDAIILLDGERLRVPSGQRRHFKLAAQRVMVVQTKAAPLGMSLLGQAFFSRHLVEALGPASVRSVALCRRGDAVLESLASRHGVEVVVMPRPTR